MTTKTTSPTKKLDLIRQKMSALKQEEAKIRHDLSEDLSKTLLDAQALEVGFDVLIGGVLDVIAQSKTDANKSETWRNAGQKFLRNRNRRERGKGHG